MQSHWTSNSQRSMGDAHQRFRQRALPALLLQELLVAQGAAAVERRAHRMQPLAQDQRLQRPRRAVTTCSALIGLDSTHALAVPAVKRFCL